MLLLLAAAAASSQARADAIDPDAPALECDPLPCPEGSTEAALGHSSCPSVCAPNTECRTTADCLDYYGEGARCEPTRFCVGVEYAGPGMSEAVYDACAPDGPCGASAPPAAEGSERPRCVEVSRCVAPPAPAPAQAAPSGRGGGCAGCAVAAREARASSLAGLVALVLLVVGRGRARRRRGSPGGPLSRGESSRG